MATCIAFFRDLNVDGQNRLSMKELLQQFESVGIHGARSYLQNGNVAFRCTRQQRPEIARRLTSAIRQQHGLEPKIHVITIQELEHAVAANPFMDARKDASNLVLWFLEEVPANPDLAALDGLKTDSERFVLDRKVFYLHSPDGVGNSKLTAAVETSLGTDAVARDWQTATKTLELAWDLP